MKNAPLHITFIGSSITSSLGNPHAPVFRGLVRELALRGHRVMFLERDKPLYAENRDATAPAYGRFGLYYSVVDLKTRFREEIAEADAVIIGSSLVNGCEVAQTVLDMANGITAFYDLDASQTLDAVEKDYCPYLNRTQIRQFDLYLSAAGGPVLERLEREFYAPRAHALYHAADTVAYYPETQERVYDLAFSGPFSEDQYPLLERFLINPACIKPTARFAVSGHPLPHTIKWPNNVKRIPHIPSHQRRAFFNWQRFNLNIPNAYLAFNGYAPSTAIFEAAACGTPVITPKWAGLTSFFEPNKEIMMVKSTSELLEIVTEMSPSESAALGQRARERVLAEHTAAHRAAELECLLLETRMDEVTLEPIQKNGTRFL